jgi:toxin ParE1/3/4
MKKYKVFFRPLAEADLLGLFHFIAEESGAAAAAAYIDRLEAACLALERFPMRGTRRDDISPGLRILGFERRAAIAFQVDRDKVEILRIFYGGRDYAHLLATGPD